MGGFIHYNRWMNGEVWMQSGAQGGRQGKEAGRDGERGAEKERERQKEAEVEAEVLFRFQIWAGLGQISPEKPGCATFGLCLGPRDLFLLPRPPRVLCLRTAPEHGSKEAVIEQRISFRFPRHSLVFRFLWILQHPPTMAPGMVPLPNVWLATLDHHPPPLLSSHLSAHQVSSAFA